MKGGRKPHDMVTEKVSKPVGYVDVDDAGFQELPLLVGAGNKQPPLVV